MHTVYCTSCITVSIPVILYIPVNHKLQSAKILNENPEECTVPGESKKRFQSLAGYRIKSMFLIFKTKMLIYQSKANLDEEILFGKVRHLKGSPSS